MQRSDMQTIDQGNAADLEKTLENAQADLRRKDEEIERLSHSTYRFLDDVAHDFKTPIAVIREFTSILSDGLGGPVTPEQAEYLSIIMEASENLSGMVNDLLDTGRFKVGRLNVNREMVDPREILDSVVALLDKKMTDRNLSIGIDTVPDLPLVSVDQRIAVRALFNLAANPIKLAAEGSEIQFHGFRCGDGCVQIDIISRGREISDSDIGMILEHLKPTGYIAKESPGGFGLGLQIAGDLALVNLGEVSVENRGEGECSFSLTMPELTQCPDRK